MDLFIFPVIFSIETIRLHIIFMLKLALNEAKANFGEFPSAQLAGIYVSFF